MPAPELHAEIFDSPLRRTRVPGVSVLTPAKKGRQVGRDDDDEMGVKEKEKVQGQRRRDVWDSDSDDEGLEEGMSPPKTMQFHVPRERLLRTPGMYYLKKGGWDVRLILSIAREASKRIVEDLLLTAGGNVTDDLDEDSPSVVRRTQALDEDTF